MPTVFLILIICAAGMLLYLYALKKKRYRTEVLPRQKELIEKLIVDLQGRKHDIILSKDGSPVNMVNFSLLEMRDCFENKHQFSKEKYEEHSVLFADASNQLIDFGKYIADPLLPREILNELELFHNTDYTQIVPGQEYFIVLPAVTEETGERVIDNGCLYSGSAEAYETWLTFRESIQNLNYVILQWIKDNGGSQEAQAYATSGKSRESVVIF